jgi:hypothetical protein
MPDDSSSTAISGGKEPRGKSHDSGSPRPRDAARPREAARSREPANPGGRPAPRRHWGATLARAVLVLSGMAILGAGVSVTLQGLDTGPAITCIIAGTLLLISPFLLTRLEQLALRKSGVQGQLTRTLNELGAPQTAKLLDSTDVVRFADSYGFIHHTLDEPQYRAAQVHLEDTLIARAAEIAMTNSFEAREVQTVFRDGPPVIRALALGLMQGDAGLIDADTIISAIVDSRSSNEQYHGLQLATRSWHKLSRDQQQSILTYIKSDPSIDSHSGRARLAGELRLRTQV